MEKHFPSLVTPLTLCAGLMMMATSALAAERTSTGEDLDSVGTQRSLEMKAGQKDAAFQAVMEHYNTQLAAQNVIFTRTNNCAAQAKLYSQVTGTCIDVATTVNGNYVPNDGPPEEACEPILQLMGQCGEGGLFGGDNKLPGGGGGGSDR